MAKELKTIGNVSYTSGGRVWTFTHEPSGYQLRRDVPGGALNAAKVAKIIDGSFTRAIKAGRKALDIDGLARANIHQVFHSITKTTGVNLVRQFPQHRFSFIAHV